LNVAGTTTQRLIINLVIALITGLLFLRMGHSQSGTRPTALAKKLTQNTY
jgi:hypothetical protein